MENKKTLSTREAFIRAFTELHRADRRHVLVSADSVLAARAAPVREQFPRRALETGICEQNAVAMAAGLAAGGLFPWVVTLRGLSDHARPARDSQLYRLSRPHVRLVGLNGGLRAASARA
jgi:transketolase